MNYALLKALNLFGRTDYDVQYMNTLDHPVFIMSIVCLTGTKSRA
jgi:hypothetical protein